MSKQNGGIIGPNNIPTGAFGSASGVWKLSDVVNYKKQKTWPVVLNNFQIDNSCRFNTASSDYLTKTYSTTASSKKILTVSAWVKRSTLGVIQEVFSASRASDGFQTDMIRFGASDQLEFFSFPSSGGTTSVKTNRVFRDTNAWYNIVVQVNTTDGTASDRVRMYINGVRDTSFATASYPPQNDDLTPIGIASGTVHSVGAVGTSAYYSGYLAEVVYADGQALDQDSFGEFDSQTGIWVPKPVTGLTFGNNGFYLNFQNSGALGTDVSGNGNNYTVNNLTSLDQSIDTCTNNFANLNALSKGSNITLSNGNLSASNGNTDNSVLGNMAFANGKWYWEAKCTGATTYATIGITLASIDGSNHSAVDAGRIVYSSTGYIYREGLSGQGDISGVATFTTNDIIGITFNAQNGSVAFYKNGVLINTTVDSQLLYTNNQYINAAGLNQGSFDFNFGSPTYAISSGNVDSSGMGSFEYAVPEGFYSLCTRNLNLIG
tara:strand:- start:1061 stop:2530 length:1470 start_codon:yes stop_codon:yes gene_type:complete